MLWPTPGISKTPQYQSVKGTWIDDAIGKLVVEAVTPFGAGFKLIHFRRFERSTRYLLPDRTQEDLSGLVL